MRALLLLLVASCFVGCCLKNEPRRTDTGLLLFNYVDKMLYAHCAVAMRAAELDEYYRQTTDEGRQEVITRYFWQDHIANQGNRWLVTSTQEIWVFDLVDGKSLAVAGAEWQVAYGMDGATEEPIATIRVADDGVLTMDSKIKDRRFDTSAKTQLRVVSEPQIKLMLESGSGKLDGLASPQLRVAYSIEEPISFSRWSNPQEGLLSITAQNDVDGGNEQVLARYIDGAAVDITYGGVTERRYRYDMDGEE